MAPEAKKSRLSNGISSVPDVVAFFPHNRPRRVEELRLEEHIVSPDEKAYTVADSASQCSSIFEVGREVTGEDDGMEYALAFVNKRTGKTKVKRARVVCFQATFGEDLEEAIGKKRKARTDFTKDYGVKKEEWMEAKNALSRQFAGSKKLKMLEASKRREINETTLEEMRKTAFASEGTLLEIMSEAKKEAMIDEKISLINKAESEVLPKFVDAELAKDVYPLSLFVSDNDVEECADECKELWRKSKEELEADGVLKCVHEVFKCAPHTNKTYVACALLAALTGALKRLHRSVITKEQYEEMKLPKAVLQKLRLDFLQGNWRMAKGKDSINVKVADKERMIAHALCLAVTLMPSLSIPVTPWSRALNVPEAKAVKTLTAMGCTIHNLQAADAVRWESIRAARLLSAPKEGEGRRRFRKTM
ncbi:hypothetical protein PMAYCL1PPCAC_23285 [Pristionchus mayeri]|uniref:Uncharacterized protein n=1 Tax=Pristionchus mayeri TaxID=1317129 RepID=A0AAN5CZ32_9BILA|nr:hypothetical protein PMAYCL1PPCAC_23285 [Pristionchus mayeri]